MEDNIQQAANRFVSKTLSGGINSMSISAGGKTVTITKAAAERIRAAGETLADTGADADEPTFPGMETTRERLREKVDMFSGEVRTIWNAPQVFRSEFAEDPNLDALYDEIRERFAYQASEWERWRIRFLWKQKGGDKLGKCTLASPIVQYLAKVDFVIWFDSSYANTVGLSEEQMAALMYHELLHVSSRQNDDGISHPAIRKHDCEVFADEIENYGPWKQDIAGIKRAFERRERIEAAS